MRASMLRRGLKRVRKEFPRLNTTYDPISYLSLLHSHLHFFADPTCKMRSSVIGAAAQCALLAYGFSIAHTDFDAAIVL